VHRDANIARDTSEQKRPTGIITLVVKAYDPADTGRVDVLNSSAIEYQMMPATLDQPLQRRLETGVIGSIDEAIELDQGVGGFLIATGDALLVGNV